MVRYLITVASPSGDEIVCWDNREEEYFLFPVSKDRRRKPSPVPIGQITAILRMIGKKLPKNSCVIMIRDKHA